MINDIFALSNDVRYVAIYRDGHLETKSKEDTIDYNGYGKTESSKIVLMFG